LGDCRNNRDPVSEDQVKRLYQWFSERASFFRSDVSGHGTSRTVCTEVTVRREGITLLLGDVAAAGFAICPLCGNKLAPGQAEQARLRIPKGSATELPTKEF
jgi:hypothetical protein